MIVHYTSLFYIFIHVMSFQVLQPVFQVRHFASHRAVPSWAAFCRCRCRRVLWMSEAALFLLEQWSFLFIPWRHKHNSNIHKLHQTPIQRAVWCVVRRHAHGSSACLLFRNLLHLQAWCAQGFQLVTAPPQNKRIKKHINKRMLLHVQV